MPYFERNDIKCPNIARHVVVDETTLEWKQAGLYLLGYLKRSRADNWVEATNKNCNSLYSQDDKVVDAFPLHNCLPNVVETIGWGRVKEYMFEVKQYSKAESRFEPFVL